MTTNEAVEQVKQRISPMSDHERIKLVIFGDKEAKIPGLIDRVEELEDFMKRVKSIEVKISGVVWGLGLNLLGIILILSQVFDWF